MKQLLILSRNLAIKQILPVDDIIPVQDIISPQKTTFEVPMNREIVIGDLIILKNNELFEYFGVIQDLENDKTTKIAGYPLINITDGEYELSTLNGDVYEWIVNAFTKNFINTNDELLKLPFTFQNNTTVTNLKLDLQDGNLFDALLTIFKKTGIYVRFSLDYENGKAVNIVCNVEKADEDTKITIRYDNPIVFETPVIELSQAQYTNKVIFKPADSTAGTQIYTFYLLDNDTVTTDASANGRINGVVQSIQTYTTDNNTFEKLKEKAEEIMLGDTLNHQITLKVINNLSYNFQLYDKVEYIDEKMRDGQNRVFETYVTRIENNNEIYKVLRLGVLRTTLTDKFKALEKAISTRATTYPSSSSSGGSSSGGAVSSVNGKTGDVELTAEDVGALPSDTPLFSGNYNDLSNKPTIPTTASEVNALPDTTRYGASIDLSIDSTTYVVTAQLKDQNGNNLGSAKTIDLPLESVVVSGSYDSVNKKVILTLKDSSTIDFSVADLVSGLQTEITSSNKLSVTLIDGLSTIATSGNLSDATQDATHRTVTDTEKNTWNNKMDKTNPNGSGSFSLNRSGTVGYNSVSIGTGGTASGMYSFCEGHSNISDGESSHAEGSVTRANGAHSHAEGFYTFANGICQHAFGRSNVPDNENRYIEIVGNGDGYISNGSIMGTRQSNARTLDWQGNEYLAGNLQASGLTDGTTTKSMSEILAGNRIEYSAGDGISIVNGVISGMSAEMLWEATASEQTQSFGNGSRTLKDNNCDVFEIAYRYNTTYNFTKSVFIPAVAGQSTLLSFINTPNLMWVRSVTVNSKTLISFASSYYGNGSGEGVDNSTIIPIFVRGWKFN